MNIFNISGGSGSGLFEGTNGDYSSRMSIFLNRRRTEAELADLDYNSSSQLSTQQLGNDDQINITTRCHHDVTLVEPDPMTNSVVRSNGIMFYTNEDENSHVVEQDNHSADYDPLNLNLNFMNILNEQDPVGYVEFVPYQNPYEVLLEKSQPLNKKSTEASDDQYIGDSHLSNRQHTQECFKGPLDPLYENKNSDFENSQLTATLNTNSQMNIRASHSEDTSEAVSDIKHILNRPGRMYSNLTLPEHHTTSENCNTTQLTFPMPMEKAGSQEATGLAEHKFIIPDTIQQNNSIPEVTASQNDILLLPFACDLCNERFHKKLLLNNHVERRHGIKFVFTQKGQKVKLVRMPEIFHEGEKVDPCVQLLMEASDKKRSKNIIGVQAMDNPDQQVQYQSDVHQEINTQELLKNKNGQGMGILVANIPFPALKIASDNAETPFAVFSPYNSEKLYLLNILQMNATRQMLLPATLDDLEKSSGSTKEEITYFTTKKAVDPVSDTQESFNAKTLSLPEDNGIEVNQQGDESIFSNSTEKNGHGPSNNLVKKTRRIFSHIAVVAILKQVLDKDTGKCTLKIGPSATHNLEKVELCPSKEFVRFGIQCKVKRLRCFSETTSLISPPPSPVKELPKPKRKYVRKTTAGVSDEKCTEKLPHQVGTNENNINVASKKLKVERGDGNSDNQSDDTTYKPDLCIPKSKKRRGRPKKLIFDDESTVLAADKLASVLEEIHIQSKVEYKETTQTYVVPDVGKNKTFVPRLRGPKRSIKKKRKTALDISEPSSEEQLVKIEPDESGDESEGLKVDQEDTSDDFVEENVCICEESAFDENKDIMFENPSAISGKGIVKKGKASLNLEIESAFQDFTFSPFQEPEIKEGKKIKPRALVEGTVNKVNESLKSISNLRNITNKINIAINRRQGRRLKHRVVKS